MNAKCVAMSTYFNYLSHGYKTVGGGAPAKTQILHLLRERDVGLSSSKIFISSEGSNQ